MYYVHYSLIKRTQKISEEETKYTNLVALSKSNNLCKSKKTKEHCKSCKADRSSPWPSCFPESAITVNFYTVEFLNVELETATQLLVGPIKHDRLFIGSTDFLGVASRFMWSHYLASSYKIQRREEKFTQDGQILIGRTFSLDKSYIHIWILCLAVPNFSLVTSNL